MLRNRCRLADCTPLLFLLVLGGCGPQGSGTAIDETAAIRAAVKYNDEVAAANVAISEAATAFGDAIPPALLGEAGALANCRQAQEECLRVAEQVKADSEALAVPDSDAARALQSRHRDFLDVQVAMCRKEFRDILALLEDEDVSVQQKALRIKRIFDLVEAQDEAKLAPLKAAQRAYASAHNFTIPEAAPEAAPSN